MARVSFFVPIFNVCQPPPYITILLTLRLGTAPVSIVLCSRRCAKKGKSGIAFHWHKASRSSVTILQQPKVVYLFASWVAYRHSHTHTYIRGGREAWKRRKPPIKELALPPLQPCIPHVHHPIHGRNGRNHLDCYL